jgi:hypothetical protein
MLALQSRTSVLHVAAKLLEWRRPYETRKLHDLAA